MAHTVELGVIVSFVTLTGIAHAYESADNNHKGGMTIVTSDHRSGHIGIRPYCGVQLC